MSYLNICFKDLLLNSYYMNILHNPCENGHGVTYFVAAFVWHYLKVDRKFHQPITGLQARWRNCGISNPSQSQSYATVGSQILANHSASHLWDIKMLSQWNCFKAVKYYILKQLWDIDHDIWLPKNH